MILIIDGYNVVKRVFDGHGKARSERHKEYFIRLLGQYRRVRPSITQIILVFDGGMFRHAEREVHAGIVVVHAGQASSADDWIADYVARNKAGSIVVVTDDLGIIRDITCNGADAVGSQDFYNFVQAAVQTESDVQAHQTFGSGLIKYNVQDNDVERSQEDVLRDLLMEQASMSVPDKGEPVKVEHARGGQKASKKDRQALKIIKKL